MLGVFFAGAAGATGGVCSGLGERKKNVQVVIRITENWRCGDYTTRGNVPAGCEFVEKVRDDLLIFEP